MTASRRPNCEGASIKLPAEMRAFCRAQNAEADRATNYHVLGGLSAHSGRNYLPHTVLPTLLDRPHEGKVFKQKLHSYRPIRINYLTCYVKS